MRSAITSIIQSQSFNFSKSSKIQNNGVLKKNETITIETAGGGGYGLL